MPLTPFEKLLYKTQLKYNFEFYYEAKNLVKETFELATSDEEYEKTLELASKIQKEIDTCERKEVLVKKQHNLLEKLKVSIGNKFSDSKQELNNVIKTLNVQVTPKSIEAHELKSYGKGNVLCEHTTFTKTTNNGWDTLLKYKMPLTEGVHNFKVHVHAIGQSSGFFIGLIQENETNSTGYFQSIGIYSNPSLTTKLKDIIPKYKLKNQDDIFVNIDFPNNNVKFSINKELIAQGPLDTLKTPLNLSFYIFGKNDKYTLSYE